MMVERVLAEIVCVVVKRVLAEIVVGMEDGGCIAEVIVCDSEEGGGCIAEILRVMVRRVEGGGWKMVVVLTFQLGSS